MKLYRSAVRSLDDTFRQDDIAEYLATKYDLREIATLLLRLGNRIQDEGRPADTDTIDRWLLEIATTDRAPLPPGPPPAPKDSIVYYMRLDRLVKIGTTTNLRYRLAAVPHDELLATEPGSFSVEKSRHRQFAHLRHEDQAEWFRYEGALLDHVTFLIAAAARAETA